jgi:hypothetical protein
MMGQQLKGRKRANERRDAPVFLKASRPFHCVIVGWQPARASLSGFPQSPEYSSALVLLRVCMARCAGY